MQNWSTPVAKSAKSELDALSISWWWSATRSMTPICLQTHLLMKDGVNCKNELQK
jgi:hypothetical protein